MREPFTPDPFQWLASDVNQRFSTLARLTGCAVPNVFVSNTPVRPALILENMDAVIKAVREINELIGGSQ